MKEYYIHIGNEQIGPLNFDELKAKNIKRDTMVWHEGLTDWQKASEMEELQSLIKAVPPPINKSVSAPQPPVQNETSSRQFIYPEPPSSSRSNKNVFIFIFIGIILIIGISGFVSYQNELANQQVEYELQIAEQNRIIKEQRIQEISKELTGAYQTLDEAKAQLHDATAFKLFRTSEERHEQVTQAENVVKSWEERIAGLEEELHKLQD